MKNKFFINIFLSLVLISALFLPVSAHAACNSFNWYCIHRKDHKQPSIGADIAFVEELGGYYIDRDHSDSCEDLVVYLTFDAGYENGNVERILDTLKSENVSAAFFVLGNLITQNTELINRMFDEGHLVCNHTYSHKSMVECTKEQFETELKRLEDTCLNATGKQLAKYYRPPEGKFDKDSLCFAEEMGYKTIFWSFAYADWDNNSQPSPEKAKEKILSNVHNGEIMLLHPTSKTNADILGDVIKELKRQGFRFGTLDELCATDAT